MFSVKEILPLSDANFKKFQLKIIPNIATESVIGIRIPDLRAFEKTISDADKKIFLNELPHKFLEENLLHAIIISRQKNFDRCLMLIERFLPYIDNWAVCDSIAPKIFKLHTDKLSAKISMWLRSTETYTVRLALSMLIKFFLDKNFDEIWLERVKAIHVKNYYVDMGAAWFFATALAKHFEITSKFLLVKKVPQNILKLTVCKARDSRQLTREQKILLSELLS